MRAVGYLAPLPIDAPQSLVDLDVPEPEPTGRDLLVEIKAVSVNPVDVKVRANARPPEGQPRILGYDAAGVVLATGPDVTLFRPGDEVFYAGAIGRPGTNAERHLVDERIVGPKPKTIGFAAAAALPLTAITAWEGLFDRLDIRRPVPGAAKAVLIVGGAGGVGSIAVQLARQLTDLTVIATASRPETAEWALGLGAHHVIDHSRPMAPQVEALGIGQPGVVFSTTHTRHHLDDIVALITPQGRLGLIDDDDFDVMKLKSKSLSLHWEAMFARSSYRTADMIEQHRLLSEVSRLVDAGTLRSTLTQTLRGIDARTLRQAHKQIETGRTRGKVVLEAV